MTETLRRLEANGLVERDPAGRRYRLTALGATLIEPITALTGWAERHGGDVVDAQQAAAVGPAAA